MTVDPPGPARPGRVAGLVLLGVALIALIIGVITAIGGDGGNQGGGGTSQPPSTPPGEQPTSTPTSGDGQPRPTSSAGPATPTSVPPGTPTATPAPVPSPKAQPIRIYNNSTITGLAARARDDFAEQGWNVVEVGNFPAGRIPTSTAYFRQGTDEEAAARELGRAFGLRVEPRFPGIQSASDGVIVIVTNDYGGK